MWGKKGKMEIKLEEKHYLKTYQCDRYGVIRPVMLMNELQGLADKNAEMLNGGRTFCKEHNIAWVVTHYLVDIIELPRANEELTFSTWPSGHGGVKAIRDFEIRGADGRLMVRATSQWVLIDLKTRRPLRISEFLPEWSVLAERAFDRSFEKCADFVPSKTHVISCRYDDIDVNQHINNAVYAVWATESVGFEYRNTHKLRGLEIYFEHEINPNTPTVRIEVLLSPHETKHKIMTDETEHAKVICYWN